MESIMKTALIRIAFLHPDEGCFHWAASNPLSKWCGCLPFANETEALGHCPQGQEQAEGIFQIPTHAGIWRNGMQHGGGIGNQAEFAVERTQRFLYGYRGFLPAIG